MKCKPIKNPKKVNDSVAQKVIVVTGSSNHNSFDNFLFSRSYSLVINVQKSLVMFRNFCMRNKKDFYKM